MLGPLFLLVAIIGSFVPGLSTLAAVATGGRQCSCVLVNVTLTYTICALVEDIPQKAHIGFKLLSVKGIILTGTVQQIIIGVAVNCSNEDPIFVAEIAQQYWQSTIFLAELPLLQVQVTFDCTNARLPKYIRYLNSRWNCFVFQIALNRAYPASDLSAYFGLPTLGHIEDLTQPLSPPAYERDHPAP